MAELIAWCGFAGAWLLVAGPVFQAALELHEEDVAKEELEAATETLRPRFPPVSPWWWLLPPVYYWQRRKRSRRYRKAVMSELSAEQRDHMVSFINKATGWLFVAAGAALIGVKETWELAELYEWPHAVFWVLIVLMAVLCVLNAATRMFRAQKVLEHNRAVEADGA